MNHLIIFVSGLITGIYIDQNYKVPSLENYIKKFQKSLKSHEKNDKNN
jgi:hypothetical protein